MPLKTFVKVGSISNLSDARYCAGMGVDLLGFRVIEGQKDFIKDSQYQQIRGWITGPHIVAEVYGIKSTDQLPMILDNYKPDYLEMGLQELALFNSLPIPLILSVKEMDSIDKLYIIPDYLISNNPFNSHIPLLVRVQNKRDVRALVENPAVKGIALEGSAELKPGLKDYEVINEVLEQLETED
jgi:phosphoribosylanthranilate isomerase